MKDLFLPYELAVIAKEKNYKGECVAFYNEMHDQIKVGTILFPADSGHWDNWNKETHLVSAPLYQQIVDWLREKHNITVEPYSMVKSFKTISRETVYRVQRFGKAGYRDSNYKTLDKAITEAFKLIDLTTLTNTK
jgi:hypothetical protein